MSAHGGIADVMYSLRALPVLTLSSPRADHHSRNCSIPKPTEKEISQPKKCNKGGEDGLRTGARPSLLKLQLTTKHIHVSHSVAPSQKFFVGFKCKMICSAYSVMFASRMILPHFAFS